MTAGVFNDRARAAIYEAGGHRCIGDGRPDITTQHRRARGMGGTSDVSIGHPANGVPLCGDGVRGCHGWTEHHPALAVALGWRLEPGQAALGAPFWTRYGWHAWAETPAIDLEPFTDGPFRIPPRTVPAWPHIVYVDETDLDQLATRLDAVARYALDRPPPR